MHTLTDLQGLAVYPLTIKLGDDIELSVRYRFWNLRFAQPTFNQLREEGKHEEAVFGFCAAMVEAWDVDEPPTVETFEAIGIFTSRDIAMAILADFRKRAAVDELRTLGDAGRVATVA